MLPQWLIAVLTWCFLVSRALCLPTITATGSKFFDSDGKQFFIKGIVYSQAASSLADVLADGDQCNSDAKLMKKLGANTIRVYYVDPNASHDDCMTVFSVAGIYVLLDLTSPKSSLSRTDPEWTLDLYKSFTSILASFAAYDNLLAVLVGNEVISGESSAEAAPYIKAAARDVKAFRDASGFRKIPVGYSAADVLQLHPTLPNYLACGTNKSDAVDFYSLNSYAWCGSSSFTTSGYDALVEDSTGYDIPIFFSETGCNSNPDRLFGDQTAVLGPKMSFLWSGSFIYKWQQDDSNYGLITYGAAETSGGSNTEFPQTGEPTPISPVFDYLSKRWQTLAPSSVAKANYIPTNSPPSCPSSTANGWTIDPVAPLPTIKDLTISTSSRPSTKTSSPTRISATKSRGSGPAAASSSSQATPFRSGISTGTKIRNAFIVIGVVLIFIILGFIGYKKRFMIMRKSPDAEGKDPHGQELGGVPVSQLEAGENQIVPTREELDGRTSHIPAVNREPLEMSAEAHQR